MYCKNCGKEVANNAAVCLQCGVATGQGNRFCYNCGAETNPNAAICTSCGVAIKPAINESEQKSKIVAGLLGLFLGGLGIHNFYLGYTGKAIAQIVLSFCFGVGAIWGFIEGIMILCGAINKDAKGVPLKS